MPDIAVCAECGGEMDVTSTIPFSRVACPSCGEEVRVKVDFGNYLLQKRLAYGGMSILFVAKDQTLGRKVALKVLNEDYSGDEYRTAQFEKEAELTALVSHPNVVRVYSVGRAFDRFYIAMELIAGEHLEARLQGGQGMEEKEVLEIALQVVAGLRAAQQSGLIHRDIKPGNILVDEQGVAKIVDFGLSLVTQAGSAQAEEIFATPYYAPPEALEAKVEDVRSDIYALGATLYHALTGKPPIESSSTATKVLLEEKRKTLPLRKLAPKVSASTESLVAKMMAFEPSDRCEDYDEVTESLELALKGEDQPSRVPAKRRRKKASGLGLVGGLAVGAVLLGGGVFLFQQGKKEKEPDVTLVAPGPLTSGEGKTGVDETTKIARVYQRGRKALRAGKLGEAEYNFRSLFQKDGVPEPTRSLTGLEAGLCALLDGRTGDTRIIFSNMRESLPSTDLDSQTKSLLTDLVSNWNSLKFFPVAETCPDEADVKRWWSLPRR